MKTLKIFLASQNKHDDALVSFKRALACRVKYYGGEHPDVVDAYRMVGNARMALGQKEEALDSFNKALDILQRHLSEEHVDIIELKQTIKEISKNQ